ncbi:MAG: regulatory protein RecX [Chlamydiia bacterium]|nr:regulatory protein RecX [Chlamydiia bacterium]
MKSELTKKLNAYQIDPQASAEILSECEKLGYLDDLREGELRIKRGKRRGLGPLAIAQKVPELKELVRETFTDEEQRGEIARWIEKKTRSESLSNLKVKQRLFRFLMGKGFDPTLIREQLLVDE